MHADLESIVCKFRSDPVICLGEEAICAKVYRRTDDGRRAIALAHSWNELKIISLARPAIVDKDRAQRVKRVITLTCETD